MEDFDIFRINNHYNIDDTQGFLHLLEGAWYPKDIDTNPVKFTLTLFDASDFICQSIDNVNNNILLYHKNNASIILEIHVIHSDEMILNIKNVDALGTSPAITFIKK